MRDYYENSIANQTALAFILSDLKQILLKAYQCYTDTSVDLDSSQLKENLFLKFLDCKPIELESK